MPLELLPAVKIRASRANQPLVVADAAMRPLFNGSPSATASRWIAYAGIPLITAGGHPVGAPCAIDHEAHLCTDYEVTFLEYLAAILTTQLDAWISNSPGGRHIGTTK